jgi:hypothetical protein
MELTGKISRKAGNGKGFMMEGQENWFNTEGDAVMNELAKYVVGDTVTLEYNKKGIKQSVVNIMATTAVKKAAPAPAATSEFVCEDCGAALKDGKYKKCWTCNKKGGTGKTYAKKEWTPKAGGYVDNPEKTEQIRRGNSLNAAAAVLAGRQEDPETLAEMTIVVAERFLEWLKANE